MADGDLAGTLEGGPEGGPVLDAEKTDAEKTSERQVEIDKHKFRRWVSDVIKGLFMGGAYLSAGCLFYRRCEGWDVLTTLYFTSVSMTTIGFGDVRPLSPEGQWFTIWYALAGIALMYGSLREIFEFILQQQEQLVKVAISRLKNKLLKKPNQAVGFSITEHGRNIAGAEIHHKPLFCVRAILECVQSMCSLVVFLAHAIDKTIDKWLPGQGLVIKKLVLAILPMFFYIWTGAIIGLMEGWNFRESAYWAAMTVTTIGYGDFAPKTPSGRGFCIVYCPLAVLVLARTGMEIKNVLQEASLTKISLQKIRAMDRDGDGRVLKDEYMAAVLISMGQANEATIELLDLQFRYLDSKSRGFLDEQDLMRIEQLNVKSINEIMNLDKLLQMNEEEQRARNEQGSEAKSAAGIGSALDSLDSLDAPKKVVL